MKLKSVFLCAITLSIIFSFYSFKSQNYLNSKYVSIIIGGVNTIEDEENIDFFIRDQTGVTMSRMDRHRNMYFGIFNSNTITLNDYEAWIIGLGYTVKCSKIRNYGNQQVILLNESDCYNNEPKK